MKRMMEVDRLIFVLMTSYDINPAFYGKEHMYNPLNTRIQFANIGRTSYQLLTSTTSAQTGQLLHESVCHTVVVDRESRRPVPLPDYFVDHFRDTAIKVPTERVVSLSRPVNSDLVHYTVRWSDTDLYFHINQANYVKICFDAMVEVSREGKFKSFNGDLAKYWVKHFTCLYISEAKPGDILDIYSWEDNTNAMNVHAKAERAGQPIFQCSFWFTHPIVTKL